VFALRAKQSLLLRETPPSGKPRKTGARESAIVGGPLEPEELKEMRRRIDEILDILRIQNSILSEILPQSAKLGCQLQELSGLGKKLDIMNNSLAVIKDFVRFK